MSKPFYRYEDVPVLIAQEGEDPVMLFATSASISASQPLQAKKFLEDYNLSFAFLTGDVNFVGVQESGFVMGKPSGPARRVPSSIESIKSGERISYPNGQSLYLTEDISAGDYYVSVRSTGDTRLDINEDVPYGEVEVLRNYAAQGAVRGRVSLTYYMNTGSIHSFADLTGLMDPTIYPQVNESRVTGSIGNYHFQDGYLTELSFSARPFEVIEASVEIDVYGRMHYEEGFSEKIIENYGCLKEDQHSVPHSVTTQIEGVQSVGIEHPLSFDYSIRANRVPEIPLPISGYIDEDGELPTRVAKNEVDITINLEGEKLNPFLQITGQRADVTIKLSDLGFSKEFTDNNEGVMKEFRLAGSLVLPDAVPEELSQYGVVDQDAIRISEGGFLKGRATIRQSYR